MPNRIAMKAQGYPKQYMFLDQTAQLILMARDNISTMFRGCGLGSKLSPPSLAAVTQVPQITAGQSEMFQSYSSTAAALQADWESLLSEYNSVLDKVRASANISTECQNGFNTAISAFNHAVGVPPTVGESEDQNLWTAMDTTVQQADTLYTAANANQAVTGSSIPSTAGGATGSTAGSDADQQAADELAAAEKADAAAGSGSGISTGASTAYSSLFPSSGTDGAYSGSGYTTGNSYGTGNSDIASELQNAIDSLQNSADTGAQTADDSGSSMMDSMLPMMMDSMMNRSGADSGLNNPANPVNPNGTIQSTTPPPVTPPPVSQSPAAAQAAQPAAPAPAVGATGPSSTQPTLGQPAPNSDGSVTYTFDDGRTQKVSAVVAQALDAARANADGTDAQAAYAKTPVKWSDAKHIGDSVDPYQLMTGDVATWDNRTAIVVVFPPDQASATGSLEVMVQGKLQPFTPEMSDKQGDFGQFNGFDHPHGIEMSGGSAASTGFTAPTSGDPTGASVDPTGGATAAPAVAAPTG